MQSKNKRPPNQAESRHIQRVAELPCSVCDAHGPSEVHEIEQGKWRLSVSLCADCHRGAHNGIHGRKSIWNAKKMTELDALSVTIERLMEGA